MRHELNGNVIDSVRNVFLALTIKNESLSKNKSISLENTGWFLITESTKCANTECLSIIVDKKEILMYPFLWNLYPDFFKAFKKWTSLILFQVCIQE